LQDLPAVYFHTRFKPNGNGYFESLDGKQRCSAVVSFIDDEFPYEAPHPSTMTGKYFSELSQFDQYRVLNARLDLKIQRRTLPDSIIETMFHNLQDAKVTTVGEHLNSTKTSRIRALVAMALRTNHELSASLHRIKRDPKRFAHLEILARMGFLYMNPTVPDPEKEELLHWWRTGDITNFQNFVNSVVQICNFLVSNSIRGPQAKTVYLPYMRVALNRPQLMAKIASKIASGDRPDFSHVGGNHSAGMARYELLLSTV